MASARTSDEFFHVVIDTNSQTEYTRGKFLGKGGFPHVYEFMDKKANVVYAGKIIPKRHLTSDILWQYLEEEINIHRTLCHENVVRFHGHFEDAKDVYIILELCTRQSLEEMHRPRGWWSESEVRYLMRKLLRACEYLVQEHVIQRDLKPGNLLLTKHSQLKVAEFRLATRVPYSWQLKRTICGTTNYMAPEMLAQKGYSYAADIWAVGCIMYKLLVGRPPFDSPSSAETVVRIKMNRFKIPSTVSPEASALIRWILQPAPARRPSIEAIMHHEFMMKGLLPPDLPASYEGTQHRSGLNRPETRGGNARCYEFVGKKANLVYAGKIVSKSHLQSDVNRQYLEQEINIHRTLCHKHVVRFHGHFEDAKNVYIILELCTRQSLEKVRRWRRILSEFEVRNLMRQLLRACEYLVQEHVIHRDLKLGNLLLTTGSQLKMADFGLATRVHYEGQLKRSICGTTNYMAPEMLTQKGYSYSADIWAVGCIM
ncbi:serine/threonine-protein kinase PLK1-like [Amblyomma americanum]